MGNQLLTPEVQFPTFSAFSTAKGAPPPDPGLARARKRQFGVVFPGPNHCWAHGGARGPKILPRADLCKSTAPVQSELVSAKPIPIEQE